MYSGPAAVIVWACDANYFPLACELLESIQTTMPGWGVDLGMLDLGLLPEQRKHFADAGVKIVVPGWDVPGVRPPAEQNWYKAMTARPFLPRYFPQHEIIMWLDADIWVQRGEGIELFLQGAERSGFAIVPEIHRCYHLHYGPSGSMAIHKEAYEMAFGPEAAAQLLQYPILNSGAFAARCGSPIWERWAERCRLAMSRNPNKHSEQAALNAALHGFKPLAFHPLPASCNWICPQSRPVWDPEAREFVEPALPHEPLRLIHLCHPDFHQPMSVACRTGGTKMMGFRRQYVMEAMRSERPGEA